MSPIGHTERGFADYADFTDTHGTRVRVRQSSCALLFRGNVREEGPFVWVFVADKREVDPVTGNTLTPATHLNREQATLLRDALSEWLEEA